MPISRIGGDNTVGNYEMQFAECGLQAVDSDKTGGSHKSYKNELQRLVTMKLVKTRILLSRPDAKGLTVTLETTGIATKPGGTVRSSLDSIGTVTPLA